MQTVDISSVITALAEEKGISVAEVAGTAITMLMSELMVNADSDSAYLTIAQVCKVYGCCESTVRRLIHSGKVRAVKLGKYYKVDARSMKAYIDAESRGRNI